MLEKLPSKLRYRQDLTPEDLEAQAEAYDIETLRIADFQGPPLFTHGGKASRGR